MKKAGLGMYLKSKLVLAIQKMPLYQNKYALHVPCDTNYVHLHKLSVEDINGNFPFLFTGC